MGIPFDLKLDARNDLIFTDGDLTLTTTKAEMAGQTLSITLRTFRGEWFMNTNFGIPYLQEIIGVAKKKEVVDRIFLSTIANNIYVDDINSYTSSYDRDERYYTMNVTVTAGEEYVTSLFSTQPSEEFIYPDAGENNAAITCEAFEIVEAANRLYRFINIVGLPKGTYSTWWNEWAYEETIAKYLATTDGYGITTADNILLSAMVGAGEKK